MSDLVNRARDVADFSKSAPSELLRELADRIEALEAERRSLSLDLLAAQGQAEEAYAAQLKAEAERDRLREALHRLMMARAALIGCNE
jgi:outer membrane protein TolC